MKCSRTVPSLSPGRIWNSLCRDIKRGPAAAYHDHRTLPLIESWRWPYWGERTHTIPVHVFTGEADWRMAAWMLASWFCATDLGWSVVIHDDGTLSTQSGEKLRRICGDKLRIILRAEADSAINPQLRAFPFCEEYRTSHADSLKIFDIAHFTCGDRCLVLDSDVLFFQKPREILAWADAENEECWFCEDAVESAIITAAEARDELGVKLWRRVDTGISLLWKTAIDFDFVDRALAQTSILRGEPDRVASTLLSLCASQHNVGGLLPKTYEVSIERRAAADAVARHYSGTTRERFFGEGLKRLREPILTVGEN